ncbi:hypothetical protein QFW77_08285 [Luteimonas sp. RD2P54]|uniref:Heparinase n=1 Tax=Luteimonas endophytica TaxID=3042023 RepID=A0ABT6J833_9GAMM|nr:hypothetical protein [Luteimonas endophytica]MDH5822986.1 hypothetical protein [Luteimonas endophytica]
MFKPLIFLLLLCLAIVLALPSLSPSHSDTRAQPGGQSHSQRDEIIANASDAIRAYDSEDLQSFHGHYSSLRYLAMPSPGIAMPAFERLSADLKDFFYVEFNVPSQTPEKILLDVVVDGDLVGHVRGGNDIQISFVNSWKWANITAPRRRPEQGLASLRVARARGHLRLCLNQRCVTSDEAGNFPKEIALHSRTPEAHLFNLQMIDSSGRRDWMESNGSLTREAPAPRRVLAWERMSKTIYHTALNLYAGFILCAQERSTTPDDCATIRKRAPAVAGAMALQLAQWPNWRTYDATAPAGSLPLNTGFSAWDKGNWANGYLPYAVMLLAHLADGANWGETSEAVLPAYRILGEQYLRNELFHERAGHWIKRSNNHGGIILGNGYAAQLLANQCREDELAADLRASFRKVAEGSFLNGVYAESFTYLQVFVLESFPAVFTRQQCFGETFPAAFSQLYGDVSLSEIAAASHFLTTPDGGALVPFGDCCGTSVWRKDSLEVLSRAYPALHDSVEKGLYGMEGNPAFVFLSSDGAATEVGSDSHPDAGTHLSSGSALECFHSGLGIAAGRVDTGMGLLQSAISSTRLHFTHNKDWDLGSVYLALDGDVIIGERLDGDPGRHRQATRHSTAWIERVVDQYPGCFSDSTEDCPSRTINGEIQNQAGTEGTCSARARLNSGSNSFREWKLQTSPEGIARVRIADFIDTRNDGQVLFAHFELPGDVSRVEDGQTLRIVRDRWQADIQINGYQIARMQPKQTEYGTYTSLDLSSPELPPAADPTAAGTVTITIRPRGEGRARQQ